MQISHLKYSIFKINSAVPFYVLEQIRIKDKIRHPVIREVVTMQGETYVIIALILALASGERTECRWSAEYLCGDKCLKVANSCYCGNETIKFDDAQNRSCCNQGECVKDDVIGNVRCPNGSTHNWRTPCNGTCKQYAKYGHSTISCDDKEQCVKELTLYRGYPVCNE